jgi:hypothetical protein
MIAAHVGGVPVEELLPLAGSVGAGLALARAWLSLRLRNPNEHVNERSRK